MIQEESSSISPQSSIKPAPSAFPGWMIGLMFLGVGLFGGLLIGKYVYTPKPIPQPIVSVSPTPTSDPTANWKTYTNNVYKFSLKYPTGWKHLEVPDNTYKTYNNEVWFTHADFPPSGTGARADIVFVATALDPSTDWQPKYFDNYRSIDYRLGNMAAKKITGINKEGLNQELVIIAKIGNHYLQVLSNQGEESLRYFDQILSTFKFLNSSDKSYVCPDAEYVDCMPGPGVRKVECGPEYLQWAQTNCPNFKGAAY